MTDEPSGKPRKTGRPKTPKNERWRTYGPGHIVRDYGISMHVALYSAPRDTRKKRTALLSVNVSIGVDTVQDGKRASDLIHKYILSLASTDLLKLTELAQCEADPAFESSATTELTNDEQSESRLAAGR